MTDTPSAFVRMAPDWWDGEWSFAEVQRRHRLLKERADQLNDAFDKEWEKRAERYDD